MAKVILYKAQGFDYVLKFFKDKDAAYKFQNKQYDNLWNFVPESYEVIGKKSGLYFSQMDKAGVRLIPKSALYN